MKEELAKVKEEIYQAMKYTKKMLPQVIDCVNDLFGCNPPKVDIIYGSQLGVRLLNRDIEDALGGFYHDKTQNFIVFPIHEFPVVVNDYREVHEINIDPLHISVIVLGEEYSHYVHAWLHGFKEAPKDLESHFIFRVIVNARCEAVAEIANQRVKEKLGYSDDLESFSFWINEHAKEKIRENKIGGTLNTTIRKIDVCSYPLEEFYVGNLKEMSSSDFQKWLREDLFEINEKDLIEAVTILQTTVEEFIK